MKGGKKEPKYSKLMIVMEMISEQNRIKSTTNLFLASESNLVYTGIV